MSEEEKMLQGKIYDSQDDFIREVRGKAHHLCRLYNETDEGEVEKRKAILDELFGYPFPGYLQGPIQFDYGRYTKVGENFYANFNLVVLDTCPVTIGKNVFLGPNVSLVTPMHPFLPEERNPYTNQAGWLTDKEYAKPITIGDDCWIASNVTVCGGVHIGVGCVIGAGSVVTRDIPPHSLAAGNPCRVIRKLTPEDSIFRKPNLW